MKNVSHLVCIIALTAGAMVWSQAGPKEARAVPQVSDLETVASFLRYYIFLNQEMSRLAARGQAREPMEADAAKLFGIGINDYTLIYPVARDTIAALRKIDETAASYVRRSASGPAAADRVVLEAYEKKRQTIVHSGIRRLQGILSSKGWQALKRYIDESHRNNIRTFSTRDRPH